MNKPALLMLEDGTVFHGVSIGADGCSAGEVVFNTSLTGYQEILSDPSYAKQIVTLTYPHIGNVGTNDEDNESTGVFASGLVIRDLPVLASNFRSQKGLSEYLQANNVVAIADIDTRQLTRLLRDKGAQRGCIIAGEEIDEVAAKKALDAFHGLKGMDLAKQVSTTESYEWTENTWDLQQGYIQAENSTKYVVAYDFGVKRNILRLLANRGCRVTVVPATTTAADVLAMNPDGVFLSNGPGDPEPCTYAIEAIQIILEKQIPVFGICLGHQLLALACGAKTEKMKFGHHGANHPVQEKSSGRVMISSQNHGFAVDEKTLPDNLTATYHSLFDGSLQGVARTDIPAMSFQGHPEASPGPHDVESLFDDFMAMMQQAN
ncbi:carbamoyl-phosphate synthase small subunit [Bathymodiolus japonicus methanotrophic gill symbiont]|uniref:glutamine-hydrolyzing carbamoyl-phosphate synthase small subunit n=1 Tax=Bathymodiolus japonicus methanotrophic gill symbiont TaxID=113269 RepID=UPI001B7A8446|nr:glutamine-hydrolyzing carbamoyl-phosphate synthase small subunit [Bathymodiolus japonicus methanotrophic gill symbiont]GFO72451.1 carbamoyl-phosphate synthase small subunit [Bathymodiolus japonicus methanotrophic gill symbiont]